MQLPPGVPTDVCRRSRSRVHCKSATGGDQAHSPCTMRVWQVHFVDRHPRICRKQLPSAYCDARGRYQPGALGSRVHLDMNCRQPVHVGQALMAAPGGNATTSNKQTMSAASQLKLCKPLQRGHCYDQQGAGRVPPRREHLTGICCSLEVCTCRAATQQSRGTRLSQRTPNPSTGPERRHSVMVPSERTRSAGSADVQAHYPALPTARSTATVEPP